MKIIKIFFETDKLIKMNDFIIYINYELLINNNLNLNDIFNKLNIKNINYKLLFNSCHNSFNEIKEYFYYY